MASSSNRKSSSSVSKASKPTFRRAGKGSAQPRTVSSSHTAPTSSSRSFSSGLSGASRARVSSVSTRPVAAPRPKPARKPRRVEPARPATAKRFVASRPAAAPKQPPRAAASSKKAADVVRKRTTARPTPGAAHVRVAATPRPQEPTPRRSGRVLAIITAPFRALGRLIGRLVSGRVVAIVVGALLTLVVGGIVVVNSPIFAVTEVVISGSEHVSQETAERLISVPDGATLFNVNTDALAESLMSDPWVSGVTIEREFPHTLRITPAERTVSAIAYITADDIAWAISDDGHWIAPISLAVTVDAEGNIVEDAASTGQVTAAAEGTTRLTGLDAARVLAQRDGALLFTDVSADIDPTSGAEVASDVITAGLSYAKGFSASFRARIQSMSLSSVDAITAYLDSGVEVALGAPDDIETKELIVTRLLEQQEGVTYINVRTPDQYTFRSAPAS